MLAVNALIFIICMIALSNYYIFRSFYGDRFQVRFTEATEGLRRRMIEANEEMALRLGDKMVDGEEPEELIEFGEIWRRRLQVIKTLDMEKGRMDGHIRFIYYMLVFGLVHAAFEMVYPQPLIEVMGVKVYPSTIGWVFTLFAAVLLVLYQLFYRRLELSLRDAEAEAGGAPD